MNQGTLQHTYKSLPPNSRKYWKQRYSIFSKFDQGILMNSELWFSVTPESVAIFIAKYIDAHFLVEKMEGKPQTVLDVFCGGGGNSIQFAKRFSHCIAFDYNEQNLYCCENNCAVYGINNDKVSYVKGDWTQLDDRLQFAKGAEEFGNIDVIFASPPWGGPGYKRNESFDLDCLEPMPIRDLLCSFFEITKDVCLFLPRSSDLSQLSLVTRDLLGDEAKCKVIHLFIDDIHEKGILVMFGRFAVEHPSGDNAS